MRFNILGGSECSPNVIPRVHTGALRPSVVAAQIAQRTEGEDWTLKARSNTEYDLYLASDR